MKDTLRRVKDVPFIAWLILGFVVAELVLMRLPAVISWDGSVYVGMGKYLFSFGHVGLWETLRPVGLPILLGLGWKLGLDPYAFGQVVSIAGAALSLYFAHQLGDMLRPGAGRLSAAVLAMSSLFVTYASIPMTDIVSGAFVLGSVTFALSAQRTRGYVLSGLFAGLAFLFRFPHGIVFVVSGIAVLMREGARLFSNERRMAWFHVLGSGAGFLAVALPFFVANYFAYGDPLLPLRAGSAIIQNFPQLYAHPWSFYLTALFWMNPLVVLAVIPLVAAFAWRGAAARVRTLTVMLFLALYLGYFIHLPHKELRYSLAFLPMIMILAGVGLAWCAERVGGKRGVTIMALVCLVWSATVFWHVGTQSTRNDQTYDAVGAALRSYEARTGTAPVLVSAAPFPVSRSNARIVATLYDDWREVLGVYTAHEAETTHVLIDTCTLEAACRFDTHCTDGKSEALKRIESLNTAVVDGMVGACHVTLYERK